jgi:hypothetical protein
VAPEVGMIVVAVNNVYGTMFKGGFPFIEDGAAGRPYFQARGIALQYYGMCVVDS